MLSGALNTGVLRPIHSLELRQTVEGDEDEDFKVRWSNKPWLVKQDTSQNVDNVITS